MNDDAQHLLSQLCAEYDALSQTCQSRAFPEFSATIQTKFGHCFVRCPVGSQRFSIVAVNFTPSVRSQGVLTAFIDYVKQCPYTIEALRLLSSKTEDWRNTCYHLGGDTNPYLPNSSALKHQH